MLNLVYLRQTLRSMRETPLITIITIAGTAMAISMIMVIVIAYNVRYANYPPETHRDRMLYVKRGSFVHKTDGTANGLNTIRVIRECFVPLSNTEAVTAVSSRELLVSVPAGANEFKAEIAYTDAAFWRVFDFRFLAGKPFTKEEVESGIHRAVINEALARGLYGTVDVVGRTLLVSYVEYTICGVVPTVSTLAEAAYGEVWLPHTTAAFHTRSWAEDTVGDFCCFILARSRSDIPAIRQEAADRVARMNTSLQNGEYILRQQPDTHFVQSLRGRVSHIPDVTRTILRYTLIILILLLVPAINLSGITLSRMQRRTAEIGVRKAFGANRVTILRQILYENLILTLIGGGVGLCLSYAAVTSMTRWLLGTPMSYLRDGAPSINADMILSPGVFLYAFLFCLVLNLLSAGVPAWRVSGRNITTALNDSN